MAHAYDRYDYDDGPDEEIAYHRGCGGVVHFTHTPETRWEPGYTEAVCGTCGQDVAEEESSSDPDAGIICEGCGEEIEDDRRGMLMCDKCEGGESDAGSQRAS